MAKKKNKLNKLEISFLIYGILLLIVTSVFIGYSLFSLSGKLLQAFSTDQKTTQFVKFNIEGFKQLNLK